jgi:uncharacterized protein YjiS (DUF1127 family)
MTKHVVIDGRYGDRGNLSTGVFQTVWTATVKPLLTKYLEHRKKRRALAELRSVDPRTLKDMGIDRSEVTSIVYGPPNGRRRNCTENKLVSPYEGHRWCDSTERELIDDRANCPFSRF